MKKWLRRIAFALAIAFLGLTLTNASWLAPDPQGAVKLIAHRGMAQISAEPDSEDESCTATRIEAPYHPYLENTFEGALRAFKFGVPMVGIDIARTADGAIVLFGDSMLDCRTDGSGAVSDKTLEELKALDIAHGYSADGGKTFPLRGTGTGKMATLEEMLAALPQRARLMYNLRSEDPVTVQLLVSTLREAGRDPAAARDAFHGVPKAIAQIRTAYPEAWAWSPESAQECSRAYMLIGWSGYLPQSCRGGTMVIRLDRQFPFWGWPNRLIARMEEHGGQIVVTGPHDFEDTARGITLPEQLGEVPSTFNGYLWVEDAFAITPALHSRFDNRSQEEIDATTRAMTKRRANQ